MSTFVDPTGQLQRNWTAAIWQGLHFDIFTNANQMPTNINDSWKPCKHCALRAKNGNRRPRAATNIKSNNFNSRVRRATGTSQAANALPYASTVLARRFPQNRGVWSLLKRNFASGAMWRETPRLLDLDLQLYSLGSKDVEPQNPHEALKGKGRY